MSNNRDPFERLIESLVGPPDHRTEEEKEGDRCEERATAIRNAADNQEVLLELTVSYKRKAEQAGVFNESVIDQMVMMYHAGLVHTMGHQ